MKLRVFLVIAFTLSAVMAAAQDEDQEISLSFAVNGKSEPCPNRKVALRLDGSLIVPKPSTHGFWVPEAFRKKTADWPEGKKVEISINCGEYRFEFSEHPSWVSAGSWEVGLAYPPGWAERFGWTGATEKGTWISYLEDECNGCDPGVVTTISHPDPPPSLILSLQKEQPRASGERARDIGYALAVFNVEYQRNRDYVMALLTSCLARPKESPEDDVCDGRLLDYITNLYWRGDDSLLARLLEIADSRKDVIGEIGTFYSNLLDRRADGVLRAMQVLPSEKQRLVCSLAEENDLRVGTPKFELVLANLRAANNETGDRCLQEIEKNVGTAQ